MRYKSHPVACSQAGRFFKHKKPINMQIIKTDSTYYISTIGGEWRYYLMVTIQETNRYYIHDLTVYEFYGACRKFGLQEIERINDGDNILYGIKP
jgi:hypothetical protein